MEVSERLTAWVVRSFPKGNAEPVLAELQALSAAAVGGQDAERVHAALVVRTEGDWLQFERMLTLAKQDWRDALVAADLADDDWRDRLDAILGAQG
jgi:hypothetical protein